VRSRQWNTSEGLQLDIGAFIAGLEYASGKQATVVGKPSAAFFDAALWRLGISAEKAAMIGDDIDSDVAGAQAQGLLGVLVQTGKYREAYTKRSNIQPDLLLASIAEIV
jgi:ribonucleotide monophosphatase NagD (HAD superfamily)